MEESSSDRCKQTGKAEGTKENTARTPGPRELVGRYSGCSVRTHLGLTASLGQEDMGWLGVKGSSITGPAQGGGVTS